MRRQQILRWLHKRWLYLWSAWRGPLLVSVCLPCLSLRSHHPAPPIFPKSLIFSASPGPSLEQVIASLCTSVSSSVKWDNSNTYFREVWCGNNCLSTNFWHIMRVPSINTGVLPGWSQPQCTSVKVKTGGWRSLHFSVYFWVFFKFLWQNLIFKVTAPIIYFNHCWGPCSFVEHPCWLKSIATTRLKHASRIPHFHLPTSSSPASRRSLGETLPPPQPILIPGFCSNANISLQNQMREGKIEMLLLFMFSLKKEGENKALLILKVASLVSQWWRICLPMQEMQIWFLGQEDSWEKEMATHSSILAWEIPRMEEPSRL